MGAEADLQKIQSKGSFSGQLQPFKDVSKVFFGSQSINFFESILLAISKFNFMEIILTNYVRLGCEMKIASN
jgi:hypothetical protein